MESTLAESIDNFYEKFKHEIETLREGLYEILFSKEDSSFEAMNIHLDNFSEIIKDHIEQIKCNPNLNRQAIDLAKSKHLLEMFKSSSKIASHVENRLERTKN